MISFNVIITIVIVMAQSIVIKHINVAVICFGQTLLHGFALILYFQIIVFHTVLRFI